MSKHDHRPEQPRVHAITDAREAASIEARHRLHAYAFKMGLRAVLMIAGAIVAATWNIWVGVALLAASAVLPWIAVVDANLIADPGGDDSARFLQAPPADALPAGAQPPGDGAAAPQQGPEEGGASSATEDDVIEGSFEPGPSEGDEQQGGGQRG